MTTKEASPVKVMFPKDEVELWPGNTVNVRPLSLEDLPQVIEQFKTIMDHYEGMEKLTPIEIGSTVANSLIDILPFCTGLQAKDIPIHKIPELIEIVQRQNFPPESLGKWKALYAEMAKFLPDEQGQDKKEETSKQ